MLAQSIAFAYCVTLEQFLSRWRRPWRRKVLARQEFCLTLRRQDPRRWTTRALATLLGVDYTTVYYAVEDEWRQTKSEKRRGRLESQLKSSSARSTFT